MLRRRLSAESPLLGGAARVGAPANVMQPPSVPTASVREASRSQLTMDCHRPAFRAPASARRLWRPARRARRLPPVSFSDAVDALIDYERITDDVDTKIGAARLRRSRRPAARSRRDTIITDARQRWLFRMVHSDRPLQEKMTLFWHNHFATAYTKIAGTLGTAEATRYMAAKPSRGSGRRARTDRDAARQRARQLPRHPGHIAKDTAMLVWLDGRTNTRAMPQENFGREIMELFTMGVGHYTEADVYAAARVFTGWNLTRPAPATARSTSILLQRRRSTTPARRRSRFQIYADGSKTIPARAAADGMQDGLDLIAALARNPNTARYLATKLYRFFVSEFGEVDAAVRRSHRRRCTCRAGYDMKAVMREVLMSPQFWDERSRISRATPGRSSSWCARSRTWLARVLGGRRADAAGEHGPEPLRSARRGGMGSGPCGSRPAPCWRA